MSMRKSSMGGRPSMSGPPLRVRNEGGGRVSTSTRQSTGTTAKLRSSGSQSRLSGSSGRPQPWDTFGSKFGRGMSSSIRTSGIGVRGRTDIPKDPRPISDRGYQQQCTRKILDFLIRTNYPHAISVKLLAAPPSKDFFKMFEFIYGMISVGYKMGTKMEEEVPRILKMLGYPFTVSKTYLYTVGSPHVWPNLCAALTWMIDLVEMAEGINEHGGVDPFIFQRPMEEEGDGDPQREQERILFDYCEKTYKAFMSGFDTFEDYDEELRVCLQQKYQGRNIEELAEETRQLEEECQILEQVEDRLHRLQDDVVVQRQNLQKYQNYRAEMEIYKRSLTTKYKTVDEDCAMLETELQLKQQQLAELREMFENQQLMPTDVERMKEESANLKRQIRELELQEESLDGQCFKVNIDMAKVTEKITSEVAAYNAAATDLNLIPDSAEYANGQDYSLRHSCTSNMNNDIERTILPRLSQMKKQVKEEIRRINKQQFHRKCELEQIQETVNDREEEVTSKKEALSKLEAEIETLKQLSQKENKSRSSERSRLEQRVAELETQLKETDGIKAQEEVEYLNIFQELETARKSFENDLQILSETRDKVMDCVTHSKEDFTDELQKMVRFFEEENRKSDEQQKELEKEQQERAAWLEEKKRQLNKMMKAQ